jgi:hypothetical protein
MFFDPDQVPTNSAARPLLSVLVSPLCAHAGLGFATRHDILPLEATQARAIYFATWLLEIPLYRPYN